MLTRQERIIKAYEHLRSIGRIHTKTELANLMHASRPNVSSALHGDDKVLTDRFLARFCAVFDEFNLDWLLTGEGEMLCDTADATAMNHSIAISGHNNNASLGDTAVLEERVKALEALLAEKERLIKVYEKMMDR